VVDDKLVRAFFAKKFISQDELRAPALLRPNVDLADGRPFGRYFVLNDIAEGAFGRVVLAVDPLAQRKVALKLLKRGLPEDVERFKRESRLVLELSHPNIVRTFEVGVVGEQPYIAMAYVPGTLLRDYMADLGRRLDILVKVAHALAHAHALGIVHRDVKPENVMIDTLGEPFLMDFGLARRFDTGSQFMTTTGAIAGTPVYMSPEQASGDGAHVGPASDVFSFGATAYYVFTRSIPFPGASPEEVFRKIAEVPPTPPRDLNPRLPERLESVILKAMNKRPEQRYPGAAELAQGLESCRALVDPSAAAAASKASPAARPWWKFW